MTVERWRAFSVLDHKDDLKLAVELLLYNRILVPTAPDHDLQR
jgi:hypothetical protein